MYLILYYILGVQPDVTLKLKLKVSGNFLEILILPVTGVHNNKLLNCVQLEYTSIRR